MEDIDFGSLLFALWRGKWIILLFLVLFVVAGNRYSAMAVTPLYTAQSTVILDSQQEGRVAGLENVVGGLSTDATAINSELEVLRARGLMGKVVDRLNLTTDPEFNSRLREPGGLSKIVKTVRSVFPGGGDATTQPMLASSDPALEERIRNSAISILLRKTNVANVRNSLVFDITVTTHEPAKSALIADTIAEMYILNQIEVKFDKMEQATAWLSDRVAELQVTLERSEEAVSEFNSRTDLVSVEGLRALERQLKDTRDRIEPLRQSQSALEQTVAELRAAETREARADIADDPQLTRLFLQLDDGGDAAAQAFDQRFQRTLAQREAELMRATQQLAALEESAQTLSERLDTQSEDLIRLQQLTREAEATRLLYEHFLTRLKETSAQQGIQQADSRVLSSAVIPGGPSFPNTTRNMALMGLLGLVAGIGVILLREVRNTGFRTADELERFTGMSVLGQLPVIPGGKRVDILKYMKDKPTSAAMEAVRNMRTSLLLSNIDNPPQVIVSTSSVPGEGKTTNALALAHNFIGMGKKVLLVEGDIRRRTLNEYFDKVPKHGVVSILTGERGFDEVVFRPQELDCDILPGDKSSVNAADLFSSDKFRDFLRELRQAYDAIIIDTPPVLVVPDARIIAQSADALLFSVKWDSTSHAQISESMRLMKASNIRPTGFVLSQISSKGMKRYGYGGRYGAYGAYGTKYYAD